MKTNKIQMLEHMNWLGITADEDYDRIRSLVPRAGFYLFYDGRIVDYTEYGQEKGIFIDHEKHINVGKFSSLSMTKEQILRFCEEHQVRVPYLADLLPLQRVYQGEKVLKYINHALRLIRPHETTLPEDIFGQFWYQEMLDEAEPDDKRRLLFIENVSGRIGSPSMIIDNGTAVVSPYGDLMLQTRDGYVFSNFEVWMTFQGTVFLLASTTIPTEEGNNTFCDCKFLFSLKDDCLTFLGSSPRRFEDDVFSCSGGTYQMFNGQLIKILDYGGFVYRMDNRLVVNRSGLHGYFGGDQYMREEFYYYLEKMNGIYQLVDTDYQN